jgi:hypothetical protein
MIPRSPTSTTRWRANRSRKFVHLRGNSFWIAGVAWEDFHRDGTASGAGEKAEDDLGRAGLVVAGVTEFGERAVTAFEVSGSEVLKNQGPLEAVNVCPLSGRV